MKRLADLGVGGTNEEILEKLAAGAKFTEDVRFPGDEDRQRRSPPPAPVESHPIRTSPLPSAEDALAAAEAAAETEAETLRLFRHTSKERAILRCLLAGRHQPGGAGYIAAVAQEAGCARETVSRYMGKVRRKLLSLKV
jgi:hypothetical protein